MQTKGCPINMIELSLMTLRSEYTCVVSAGSTNDTPQHDSCVTVLWDVNKTFTCA